MSSSTRFFVMSFMNMFVVSQAKTRLGKDGKQFSVLKYLKFFVFLVVLLGLNQTVFFYFEPNNLYEEVELPRNMPISEIKNYQKDLEIKIMSQTHIPMEHRVEMVHKVTQIIKVLSHPARRLSYDTFGVADTQFAWAFKSQYFLLQTIIGSSFFYVICIFMNMMSKSKEDMKQALKFEIMLIFLIFIWEVDVIMRTESRFHETSDWLDSIYTSFPIFERREIIKVLLFPITNIFQFFLRYYLPNESEAKILKVAKHPTLRNMTSQVRDHLSSIRQTDHLEDRVQVAISQIKDKQPLPADLYLLHRQVVRGIFLSESENILVDQEILQVLQQFQLLNMVKKPSTDQE